MTRQQIISILKYVLFLGLGIWLFYIAVKDIEMDKLKHSLSNANYFYVFLTVMAMIGAHLFRAARWRMLMKASGYEVPIGSVIASVFVGYGFNTIVPRGGEFARCTILTRSEGVPFAVGFGTVITERLSDMLVLAGLFMILLFVEYENVQKIWISMSEAAAGAPVQTGMSWTKIIMIGMLVAMVLGFIAFLIFREKIVTTSIWAKFAGFGKTFKEAITSIFKLERPILFLFHTAGIWFFYLLMTYLPFLALKETENLDFYFSFIVLVIGAIGFIFPSPGGTGSYHYAVEKTFHIFRGIGQAGVIYALIAHAFQFVLTVLFGIVAWLYLEKKARIRIAAEAKSPA